MPAPSNEEIIKDAWKEAERLGAPRCAFIEGALSLLSDPPLGYAFEETKDRYVEALYLENVVPFEDGMYQISPEKLQQAYQAAAFQSSCGITTEAVWRRAGVADDRLYLWYPERAQKGGTYYAVTLEKDIAEHHGAWVSGIPWVEGSKLPEPGDAPIIGLMSDESFSRGGGFAGEHEFTIVSRLGDFAHSVDGGQPEIALRTRCLVEVFTGEDSSGRRTGELWFGQVNRESGECLLGADGRPLQGRRCIGYTDVSMLPLSADPPCASSKSRAGKIFLGALGVAAMALLVYKRKEVWRALKELPT